MLYTYNGDQLDLENIRGQKLLMNYNIWYVEFRFKPLEDVVARAAATLGNLLPTQVALTLAGRLVPSRHHRFIYFLARSRTNMLEYVCGTLEFFNTGAECRIFHVTGINISGFVHGHLRGFPSIDYSIGGLFVAAWEGPYDLMNNNCIDYAIRCWNRLGNRLLRTSNTHENVWISWDDVREARCEARDDSQLLDLWLYKHLL